MKHPDSPISVGIVSLGACAVTEPDCRFPIGGAELESLQIARVLAEAGGFDVTLYVADVGQPVRRERGMTIRPVIRMSPDLHFSAPQLVRLFCHLLRGRHDLYVTRSASGVNGLVSLAALAAGRTHLHMCSSASDKECAGQPDSSLSSLARRFHEFGMRHAHAVSCHTPQQAEVFQRTYGRAAVIFPTPLPPPPAPAAGPRAGALWVGRDAVGKQADVFVQLAARLPHHPFTLVCQPDPNQDITRLRKIAPSNLTLYEGLPFNEASALFGQHRVFVSTSVTEGVFPQTFLQAAQAGTPILSLIVDSGGTLEERNAGIVCGGNFERLVEAARMLLEDEQRWRSCEHGAQAWWQDRVMEGNRMVTLMRAIALKQAIQ
jgi:glycosyltransferase involved in cell wall biosynthesis